MSTYTTTLRFNLDRPDDRMALAYLQGAGKDEYKSLNRAVVAAVNGYFSQKARMEVDPYLETREKEDAFLRKVQETIERSLCAAPPAAGHTGALLSDPETEEDFDAALDFINGL